MTRHLQEWSIHAVGPRGPYDAPELSYSVLRGTDERGRVTTTQIMSASGRVALTRSGTRYRLGRAHPDYRDWLAECGLAYDSRHPARVHLQTARRGMP